MVVVRRMAPALAWIWTMAVLAAYLMQFRDILPALTAVWLP